MFSSKTSTGLKLTKTTGNKKNRTARQLVQLKMNCSEPRCGYEIAVNEMFVNGWRHPSSGIFAKVIEKVSTHSHKA